MDGKRLTSANEFPSDHKFNGIDLFKFICAIMVCIIHIPPFCTETAGGTLDLINFGLQQGLCRVAVPFFFVSSGFLLYRKIDVRNIDYDRIRNYCFRILRLFGTWKFLLFIGGSKHLWYMGALVLAVMILTFFIKRIPLKYIALICALLFAVGLAGDAYYSFVSPIKKIGVFRLLISGYGRLFYTTRNGVFFGLIFVFMGILFAQKRIAISKKIAAVGLLLSSVLLVVEAFAIRRFSQVDGYDMLVSQIPATFFLFALATQMKLKDRPIYARLRTVGMLVFFGHMFVDRLVRFGVDFLKGRAIDLSAIHFPLTLCIAVAAAIVIDRLSRVKRFGWLKYLYS